MLYLYIGAAIVIGLLTGFVFLSVVMVARRVGENIRMRSSEILSSYNEILGRKSEELTAVTNQLKERRKALEQLGADAGQKPAETGNTDSSQQTEAGRILQNADERNRETGYVDKGTAEIYQKIRREFRYSPQEALRRLRKTGSEVPGTAGKLLKELSYETVAQLSSLSAGEQLAILQEVLTEPDQKTLLEEYLRRSREFRIIGFYDYLKARAKTENAPACLYVSPAVAAGGVAADVNVILDDSLCEGFQIEMDNKRYDYSVTKREIS